MKISGLKEAYREARERAENYAGFGCDAEEAWAVLARRTKRSTPPLWSIIECLQDARASEDPDLIEAVEKIAARAINRLYTVDTPNSHRKADDILEVFGS